MPNQAMPSFAKATARQAREPLALVLSTVESFWMRVTHPARASRMIPAYRLPHRGMIESPAIHSPAWTSSRFPASLVRFASSRSRTPAAMLFKTIAVADLLSR
jgi:hypothetical protein